MNLKQVALEALYTQEAEAREEFVIQAQHTSNLARTKFETLFGVRPEKIEAIVGFGGRVVDTFYQGIRLRYSNFGNKGKFCMVAPCPECGEEIAGNAHITDLAALGRELRDFEPSHQHVCPAVVAPTITPVLPTWQHLLDALNRIGEELARANDRLDLVDERSDAGK